MTADQHWSVCDQLTGAEQSCLQCRSADVVWSVGGQRI